MFWSRQGTGKKVVLTEQNELLTKEKELKRKGTKAAARPSVCLQGPAGAALVQLPRP